MPRNLEPEVYDALDEALMETFPASDPVAVSEPLQRPGLEGDWSGTDKP